MPQSWCSEISLTLVQCDYDLGETNCYAALALGMDQSARFVTIGKQALFSVIEVPNENHTMRVGSRLSKRFNGILRLDKM